MIAKSNLGLTVIVLGAMAAFVLLAAALAYAAEDEGVAGKFLVASPTMGDPRFVETVIYMVRHDGTGALGLVINRPVMRLPVSKLLDDVDEADDTAEVTVHYGGPVEPQLGFIIHSGDVMVEDNLSVRDGIVVTAQPEILRRIARGEGPRLYMFALGYAGWASGQLEAEIRDGGWEVMALDRHLLFDPDHAGKWQRALNLRGIDL